MSTAPTTPQRMAPGTRDRIYSPLHKLRGTIRRYIAWETLALGIVLLAGAFWFGLAFDYGSFKIAGIDWVQFLPRGLRAVVLLCAGGLFTIIMLLAGLRLLREFHPRSLALVLEKRFPKLLRDRLITAVELTDLDQAEKYGYSRAMILETVHNVSQDVDKVPVSSVFNWGRLYRRWLVAGLLTLGVTLLVAAGYLAWNRTLNVRNFSWRFGDVSGIWFERNVLMRDTLWPRRAYLQLVDFPDSGDLRIGRDAPSPRIRVRALKWVIADRGAVDGWRALTWSDLTPELLGMSAPVLPVNLLAPPTNATNAAEAGDASWTVDRVELLLEQEEVRKRLLAGGMKSDDYEALRGVFESLEQRVGEARNSRRLRKLEIPREVKIYYSGAKTRDEAPMARQQQGVNEFAAVLTDLKESVKFYVKGEDYAIYPDRRITLVPPPMLTRLERDEYLPAYQYYLPPADGTAMDLKGKKQSRQGQGVSLTGGTSRIEIALGADLVLRGEVDKDLVDARIKYRTAGKSNEAGRIEALPIGDDKRTIRKEFPRLSAPIEFDFEFTDTDNVKSLRHIIIQPVDDKTPDVNVAVETIRKTNQGYMCTPYAIIPFSGTVRDDVGLARVEYSLTHARVESAQVTSVRAAIAAGFLGLSPISGSPRELLGAAGVLDYLTRLSESREASTTLPPIPLKTFEEIVAEKMREHVYGKEKLAELLAAQHPNLDELRRQRQITQFDIKPNLESLDLQERVPDLQRGLNDTIRPRYRVRLTVQAVDNNIETGPRTGQNRETFTFIVVPYEELLAEMNKDEEALGYKSQDLSDKMLDLRNGIDKMLERMPREDGSDEFRASVSRMDEMLSELEKGNDVTRELFSECTRLLKESQANRLPANFVETKEQLVNLLDEALRNHFERAREAHTALRDALQTRRVPEQAMINASRQRQDELNRILDQVREKLSRAIEITKLAKDLEELIRTRLQFDQLIKLLIEEEKYGLEAELGELSPKVDAIEMSRGERKTVTIDLGRDSFVKGPLRVRLTAPADSELVAPPPARVAAEVKSVQVEIVAGMKTGTFNVPTTITLPNGRAVRLKDEKPLVLKVMVK